MSNTEIDRKLALAIGYLPEHVKVRGGFCKVFWAGFWRYFTHTAPHTILPIMERYEVSVFRLETGAFRSIASVSKDCAFSGYAKHTNPRTAAALAVIKAKEMGLI
jgi:hypothetical protein